MPERPSETVVFLFANFEGGAKRRERDAAAKWSVARHIVLLDEGITARKR